MKLSRAARVVVWSSLSALGAASVVAAPLSVPSGTNDGTWTRTPPPSAIAKAIYDPVLDRLVTFEQDGGTVWAYGFPDGGGWSVLNSSGPRPSSDYHYASIYDPVRRRMVLFGSYGNNSINEAWALSLDANPQWTQLSPANPPPGVHDQVSAIYDPVGDRMVVFGDPHLIEPDNEVWALSLADEQWTRLDPTGSRPQGRRDHSAIYDPTGHRMIVFGGVTGSSTFLSDVWALSLAGGGAWSEIDPNGSGPSARTGHSAVYDPQQHRMVVFGGAPPDLNDSWSLSLSSSPAWTQLAPSGSPPYGGPHHAGVYDSARNRMIVLGGVMRGNIWGLSLAGAGEWAQVSDPNGGPFKSSDFTSIYDPVRDRMVVFGGTDVADVWALAASGEWTLLAPAGSPPPARRGHTAIYDPVRDRMVIFGGFAGGRRNDTWALSLAGAGVWSQLTPTGLPPSGRHEHSAVYDPVRDRMLVYGGVDGSFPAPFDVWALSLAGTGEWTMLEPAGDLPPARSSHTAIYDPSADQMVVFGGFDGTIPGSHLNDAWRLSLATTEWTAITPSGTPPIGRVDHTSIHDPLRNRMVMFGGSNTTHSSLFLLPDRWELSLQGDAQWRRMEPLGHIPAATRGHTAIYDPVRDRMVVFGSASSGPVMGAPWPSLQFLTWGQGTAGVPEPRVSRTIGLSPAWPNPAMHEAFARIELARRDRVTVSVIDVTGRRLRTLVDETIDAGPRVIRWDTRDERGNAVPTGIYFYTLTTGSERLQRRVVVMR